MPFICLDHILHLVITCELNISRNKWKSEYITFKSIVYNSWEMKDDIQISNDIHQYKSMNPLVFLCAKDSNSAIC